MKLKNPLSSEEYQQYRRVKFTTTLTSHNDYTDKETLVSADTYYNYTKVLDVIDNKLLLSNYPGGHRLDLLSNYLVDENNNLISFNLVGEIIPGEDGWLVELESTEGYKVGEYYYVITKYDVE